MIISAHPKIRKIQMALIGFQFGNELFPGWKLIKRPAILQHRSKLLKKSATVNLIKTNKRLPSG
jgi:hypothetical protein